MEARTPLPLSFQIKHIGDFLNTLPALGFMKSHFPGHSAGIVVTPKLAELAAAHPWVDQVFILDRSLGLSHLRRLAVEIRRHDYRTGLIFDGQTRSIVTAFLAGLDRRLGASGLYPIKGWERWLYSSDLRIAENGSKSSFFSQAEKGLRLAAAALGIEAEKGYRPPMPILSAANTARAEELLGGISGEGPLIGLTLQGLQPEKSWPLASFAALVKHLRRELGARLFVTGGPDESPAARSLARVSGVPLADFCGLTGLLDLVALADKSDLFITIDTGTSHLVALTATPLVSIFIWTSPVLWPPQSSQTRILCYDWALARFGLPANGPWRSAPVVTPEMVFEEAMALLGR